MQREPDWEGGGSGSHEGSLEEAVQAETLKAVGFW